MKASSKIPPLNYDDYYNSAISRFREATYLYSQPQFSNEYHVLITFLCIVTVECILTAYLLKNAHENGDPEPDLITTHTFKAYRNLLESSKLLKSDPQPRSVYIITNYWWNDLRYLDNEAFQKRLENRKLPENTLIATKNMYGATERIMRAGVKLWKK